MNTLSIYKSAITLGLALILFCQCSHESDQTELGDNHKKKECCTGESSTVKSETSEITCPECGHKKVETLPTKVCVIKYTCEQCGTELTPKGGDCCVFCTYGTHKCPSMQDE